MSADKVGKSIKSAYEDLFENKKKNNGTASDGAVKQWNRRMRDINKLALTNNVNVLPIYKQMFINISKGIQDGAKGKTWTNPEDFTEAAINRFEIKKERRKLTNTLQAKYWADNMEKLSFEVNEMERLVFNKNSKNFKYSGHGHEE